MARLIDADALIKQIDETVCWEASRDMFPNDYSHELHKIIELISEAPTVMQWVSVKNKLPKEMQAVIIYGKSDNEYYQNQDIGWLNDGRWMTDTIRKVTHWMPLPPPPSK